MNRRDHQLHELLSASVDGELSPSERSEVAAHVAGSSEAREAHDDFRELSGAVQALPRPGAPPELHAGVLRRIQQSLATLHRERTPAQSMAIRAASLAVAASILVLLWVGGREPREHGSIAATSRNLPRAGDGFSRDFSGRGIPAEPLAVAETEAAGSRSFADEAALPPSPAQSPASNRLYRSVPDKLIVSVEDPPDERTFQSYIDRIVDDAVIVTFTCNDVRQQADGVLQLLRNRGMSVVEPASATRSRNELPEGKATPPDGRLSCLGIYVEAGDLELVDIYDEVNAELKYQQSEARNADRANASLVSRLQVAQQGAPLVARSLRTASPADAAPPATAPAPTSFSGVVTTEAAAPEAPVAKAAPANLSGGAAPAGQSAARSRSQQTLPAQQPHPQPVQSGTTSQRSFAVSVEVPPTLMESIQRQSIPLPRQEPLPAETTREIERMEPMRQAQSRAPLSDDQTPTPRRRMLVILQAGDAPGR